MGRQNLNTSTTSVSEPEAEKNTPFFEIFPYKNDIGKQKTQNAGREIECLRPRLRQKHISLHFRRALASRKIFEKHPFLGENFSENIDGFM